MLIQQIAHGDGLGDGLVVGLPLAEPLDDKGRVLGLCLAAAEPKGKPVCEIGVDRATVAQVVEDGSVDLLKTDRMEARRDRLGGLAAVNIFIENALDANA